MRFKLTDESIKDAGVRFPKLELKKDEVARICVISSAIEATLRHWVNRVGYVHCHAKYENHQDMITIERDGGRPEECIMCDLALRNDTKDLVNLVSRHYAVYVLRYHTDYKGALLHGNLGYHVEIWLLGNKKYREVMKIQDEWGNLQKHDLELSCVEAKYQNFDISLKKQAYWMQAEKEEQKKIVEYVQEEIKKYPLIDCLGETVDKAALLRRFEIARRRTRPDDEADLSTPGAIGDIIPGSDDDSSDNEDLFNVSDNKGSIPSAVSAEEKKDTESVDDDDAGLSGLIP